MPTVSANLRWIALAFMLTWFLSACGDDTAEDDASIATVTSAVSLSAGQILAMASDRLDQTETVHFSLNIEGKTYIDSDNSIQILSAEGNLRRPDRVQASFAANLLGRANVTIRIITVGTVTWWTDLVSGAWGIAPPEIGYDASVLFSDTIGLSPVLRLFSDAELAGIEEINGTEAYRLDGTLPRTVIDDVTADTLSGETVNVQVWIAQNTEDILRVMVAESNDILADERATWTLDISRHDEPVTIDPPI